MDSAVSLNGIAPSWLPKKKYEDIALTNSEEEEEPQPKAPSARENVSTAPCQLSWPGVVKAI